MDRRRFVLGLPLSLGLLLSLAVAGCYGIGNGVMTTDAGATSDASSTDSSGVSTGLPCDVQAILQTHCTSCHSDPPVSGPMGLVTYADLSAPAVTDPTKTVAEMCLIRIQSASRPMPPAPATPLSSADTATLQSWVSAGIPMGTCGAGDGGGNPYNTPLTCTSRTYWHGDSSPVMAPGRACISCHTRSGGEAPRFAIAGTVYPTAHEPNDCNGAPGVSVVITDVHGQSFSISTNGAGNFFSAGAVATPFTAKVVSNGRERVMSTPQTSGDCNSCHSQPPLNGAPGRIMAP